MHASSDLICTAFLSTEESLQVSCPEIFLSSTSAPGIVPWFESCHYHPTGGHKASDEDEFDFN